MPRGDHKIDDAPYGIWVETVEKQDRIRVPKDIQDVVSWLKREPGAIDCIGTPGPGGGLQVAPLATHDALRSGFLTTLGDTPPTAAESGDQWVEAARLLASTWRIKVSIESSRVSMTLPEPARRVLRLPGVGGLVVVFGFGEIFEVWDAVMWHEHVRVLAKSKLSVLSDATEEMGHR